VPVAFGPLAVGMVAALLSGLLAIHFLLGWLASHRLDVFVAYRLLLAAVVVVWFLAP
jgi:undecaprenyl pyrophosphate phosphatase UppP